MAGRRGRSNEALLARAARIIALLRAHPAGLTTQELRERVGYGEVDRASQMRKLNRDLVFLGEQGWRIDTIMDGKDPARRVLRTVDNRLATQFTNGQREQLARAAVCAGPQVAAALASDLPIAELGPDFEAPLHMGPADGYARLARCQLAAADRCELQFDYRGRRRRTAPEQVLLGTSWYLRALDLTDSPAGGPAVMKTFAVDRMRNLRLGPPGSAALVPVELVGQAAIDPMARTAHPPVELQVQTDRDNLPDVVSALARHGYTVTAEPDGALLVRIPVTNMDALPGRLLELGQRVRLIGPPEAREQIRAVLAPRKVDSR